MAEFEEPSPGSWDSTRTGFALANEEAAHAAICLLMGIPVREVRIDSPLDDDDSTRGWVWTDADMSVTGLTSHVHATLAGPLICGREPSWPLSTVDSPDEAILSRLVFILGWDEERWKVAVHFVKELLAFPSVQRRIKALSGALLERGAIPGPEVKQMVNDAAKVS
jgi:hypothetical protein